MRLSGKSLKDAQKLETPLVVQCRLTDCMFHEGFVAGAANAETALCSHPGKQTVANEIHCPLYRLDWQKKLRGGK